MVAERLMNGAQVRTLVARLREPNTANLVQRWHKYHARIGLCFTSFTWATHAEDSDPKVHYLMEE